MFKVVPIAGYSLVNKTIRCSRFSRTLISDQTTLSGQNLYEPVWTEIFESHSFTYVSGRFQGEMTRTRDR